MLPCKGIGTFYEFGGEVPDNRFLSNHTRTGDKKKEKGPHNLQLIKEQKTGQSLKSFSFV